MVDPTSHAGEQKEQPASVTFDETVKDGGANDEGGQETDQYTQYDELEDEHPVGTSNISQTGPSMTQATTNEELYKDELTRGSIDRPYIVADRKGSGADCTVPMYFFEKADGTTAINLGTANRKNHECDVRLDGLSAKE